MRICCMCATSLLWFSDEITNQVVYNRKGFSWKYIKHEKRSEFNDIWEKPFLIHIAVSSIQRIIKSSLHFYKMFALFTLRDMKSGILQM